MPEKELIIYMTQIELQELKLKAEPFLKQTLYMELSTMGQLDKSNLFEFTRIEVNPIGGYDGDGTTAENVEAVAIMTELMGGQYPSGYVRKFDLQFIVAAFGEREKAKSWTKLT
jgi:hypothetical protein